MIAPPVGKGTQGVAIASHFGVPRTATGDLLRDHVARGIPLDRTVQQFLDCGELVPDEIVLEMVRRAFRGAGSGVTSSTACPGRCRRSARCTGWR